MSVTRLNYFSAKEGERDNLVAFLLEVIATIRGARGCIHCRLLTDEEHPLEVVIIEAWDSVDAHQAAARLIPPARIASVMQYLRSPPSGTYYSALSE